MAREKNKDPCQGCVWRMWIGTDAKVLCPFHACRREEYKHLWMKAGSGNGGTGEKGMDR